MQKVIHFIHQAALKLNNIGVVLLTMNCHKQGMDTLRDALCAMRMYEQLDKSPKERLSQTVDPVNAMKLVQGYLERASLQSAKPCPSEASYPPGTVVEVITCGDNPIVGVSLTSLKRVQKNAISLAFMEPQSAGSDAHSMEAGALLYNYGLSHLMLAMLNSSASHEKVLKDRASTLFRYAQELFTCVGEATLQAISQEHRLFLSVITTKHLVTLSAPSHRQGYVEKLSALVVIMKRAEDFYKTNQWVYGAQAA